MSQIFEELKKKIRSVLSEDNYKTWIDPIEFLEVNEERLLISVPNAFFKEWLIENFEPVLVLLVRELLHQDVHIEYIIRSNAASSQKRNLFVKREVVSSRNLFNPRYTFENFVVGSSNQFASAACIAVATNPGRTYNPLFIYGGTGLGKTHLLNAIGNFVLKYGKISMDRICYLTAEVFTNELINSIRYEKMEQFRNKFRRMDMLLIDDIQFIEGKERTQAEFFHTFNALYDNTKQIVITSDKSPRQIQNIEERLKSRFEWGLIADIQPPDVETKVAILNRKAEVENVSLPNDVAFFIASCAEDSVRSLEGALTRLKAFSYLYNVPITMDLARRVMGNVIKNREREISVDMVIKEVATYFSVKPTDLKSARRIRSIIFPRHIAVYLSRKLTNDSLVSIGEKFGGKDHATVLHSIKKIETELKKNKELKETVEKLEQKIKAVKDMQTNETFPHN